MYDKKGNHEYLFKWWGPDESSNLGSGMDDWPRIDELYYSKYNIDAAAWMYFFAEKMSYIAKKIKFDEKVKYYNDIAQKIKD